MTWLLLIPVFNIVWIFLVVLNMAKSLGAEFQKRGIVAEPSPAKLLGLAYAILADLFYNTVRRISGRYRALVCFIMYWVKINTYANQLEGTAPIIAAQP